VGQQFSGRHPLSAYTGAAMMFICTCVALMPPFLLEFLLFISARLEDASSPSAIRLIPLISPTWTSFSIIVLHVTRPLVFSLFLSFLLAPV
jgi:hypothetical protein